MIGVDEAGRGPLAGPVSVGVVLIPTRLNSWERFRNLRDSKHLSGRQRETWFARIKKDERIRHARAMVGAATIDKIGIVRAGNLAVARALRRLGPARHTRLLLDAGLRAPRHFEKQKSIVHGDETVPAIALASIVSKVVRDRALCRLAKRYPQYRFEIHKGYGTKAHYRALAKHGLSMIHRQTFCTRLRMSGKSV